MESQLIVHLHEVSEVAVSGSSAGKAAYEVTVEAGGVVLASSTKRNPVRSVFEEDFKFMVNGAERYPEVTLRIYEAPHEGPRKELGHAKLQPKESGKVEVLLRTVTNALVAKAAITVTVPPKQQEAKVDTLLEADEPRQTGIPRTLLYIAALAAAILVLAVVGEYAFSGKSHTPEGYGKLKFRQLLAGEYVTACVSAFDIHPEMSTQPSTYAQEPSVEGTPQCTDVVLHMQYNGNLVLSHGTSPRNKGNTIWSSKTGRWWWRTKHYAAEMLPDGMVVITRRSKVLWMNPFSIFPELQCILASP